MRKVFNFGKIAYYGKRKENLVTISITLKKKEKGYVFSASGEIWNRIMSDCLSCGQILDEIREFYLCEIKNVELFLEIYRLWKKYHLNDMHTGTERQEKALEECKNCSSYDDERRFLEKKGLLIDDGYEYGTTYLFREIKKEDLLEIAKLLDLKEEDILNGKEV